MAGDKGYSIPRIREGLRRHAIRAVIPQKINEKPIPEKFDRKAYRGRAIIEQCVGWLKECRRIATRFEKLAVSFVTMIKLAMIKKCMAYVLSDTA